MNKINNNYQFFKRAVAFSFFSFTEFQLETVSKAFHITFNLRNFQKIQKNSEKNSDFFQNESKK